MAFITLFPLAFGRGMVQGITVSAPGNAQQFARVCVCTIIMFGVFLIKRDGSSHLT